MVIPKNIINKNTSKSKNPQGSLRILENYGNQTNETNKNNFHFICPPQGFPQQTMKPPKLNDEIRGSDFEVDILGVNLLGLQMLKGLYLYHF